MPTVNINGQSIKISGSNVSVSQRNGQTYINGVSIEDYDVKPAQRLDITINGDVGSVHVEDGDVEVHGNVVNGVTAHNGDVSVDGYVQGNVSTTNGNVSAQDVHGFVNTVNGKIKHNR